MSYIRIWVHCVWTTKNRVPYLSEKINDKVRQHILTNARLKGLFIDSINGDERHFHALISLGGSQNISDVMKLIKGESSYWINRNKLTRFRFEWQDDFWSISLGENGIDNLRRYIQGQKEHYEKLSLEEEIKRLFEKGNCNWDNLQD
jgi:putative transposase